MATHYAAYGLHLACSFPLPGTQAIGPADSELPTLTLDLLEPAELDRVWSGPSGPPEWRGRLGDGLDLTIEHGSAGDLLFAYGDRARFRLHADMERLDCAPEHPGLDWQRALISKVLPAIGVMRGYEALHAAAVDSPEGVVAIMAPSGSGKSTLAIELLGRGWPLFADDVLILEDDAGTVRAHPGTPHMNLAEHSPGATDPQSLGDSLGILAGERWLAAAHTTTHTRPVRMLCMLERGAGLANETRSLGFSPLPLAPYMLGLQSDARRQRDRFTLYADMIEATPLVRMTADLEQPPRQLADLLEDALASHPRPTAGVAG
ncbi:MAG: hypothetical protein ACYDHN_13275 [Solirubrobacteraceae bacterium]